jgi:DNA-binding transcriptional LysR family regulator
MDLRLLEYFVAVVDHGGVTPAAEALYISQPSLSQAVRVLERELGTALFDRTSAGLVLTRAGHDLVGPARSALAEAEGARRTVAEVRALERGRLTVASVAGLTITPVAELVAQLRARHPGVVVSVEDPGGPVGVVASVREGRAEVGVTPLTSLPRAVDGLVVEQLWSDRIVLAGVPELVADLPDPLPLERVRELPMIVEVDDRSVPVLDDPELDRAVDRVVVRCALRATVWDLVGRGAGVTLVPARLAERILRRAELRRLEPDVTRTAGIVHRRGQLSPAAAAFVEVARSGVG